MKIYKTLINFTGGLDSTYALWDYLKTNPNDWFLVHHCNLKNFQKRDVEEAKAVKNIINELKRMGHCNFDYVETTFDYGSTNTMIHDIEVIGFLTGVLLRDTRCRINSIAITASADDFLQKSYPLRAETRFRIINTVTRGVEPNYEYPIKHLTRKDMIERIPPNLLKLLWYCRRPRNGQRCGKCSTCIKTIPYLSEK